MHDAEEFLEVVKKFKDIITASFSEPGMLEGVLHLFFTLSYFWRRAKDFQKISTFYRFHCRIERG
jgi:hypothetical protein